MMKKKQAVIYIKDDEGGFQDVEITTRYKVTCKTILYKTVVTTHQPSNYCLICNAPVTIGRTDACMTVKEMARGTSFVGMLTPPRERPKPGEREHNEQTLARARKEVADLLARAKAGATAQELEEACNA